jgi:hypothetical protein
MAERPWRPISSPDVLGTHDGDGAGDHDRPFTGFRRSSFTTRELMRLLLLRGDALEARLGHGRWAGDLGGLRPD